MKPRVYVETTIVSYLVARPSRDVVLKAHQQLTHDWWTEERPRYDLCVVTTCRPRGERWGRQDGWPSPQRVARRAT